MAHENASVRSQADHRFTKQRDSGFGRVSIANPGQKLKNAHAIV
jgi:hypothetical protein